MTYKKGFLSYSPSSVQLLTPSVLTANEAMFVYNLDKNMEKRHRAVVGEVNKNKADFGEAAATLLLMKLRLRKKHMITLSNRKQHFFVGILVVIMVYSSFLTVCHLI